MKEYILYMCPDCFDFLFDEKAELERKNRQKAYEMINQQERSR